MKKKGILNRTEMESFRVQTLERVERKSLSLKDAALILQLSYPQTKRLFSRFKQEGKEGLAHGLRGNPSNRAFNEPTKQAILRLYQLRYPDFGPTLAAEKLSMIPGVRKFLPLRSLQTYECKWRSRGLLKAHETILSSGWAIHELVRFS